MLQHRKWGGPPLKTATRLEGGAVAIDPKADDVIAAAVPATTPTAAAVANG